jgi:hypothetical protein
MLSGTTRTVAAVALLFSTAVPAGTLMTMEVIDLDTGTTEAMTNAIDVSRNAMTFIDDRERPMMIYDGAERVMYAISHDDRTYYVIDQDVMTRIGGRMSEAMQMIEQQLAQMPEEQREMMEGMFRDQIEKLSAGAGVAPDIRATGQRDTINGYEAQLYEVYRGDRKIQELWVTAPENVPNGDDVFAMISSMAEFQAELLEAMRDIPFFDGIATPYANVIEMHGIPIMTRDFDEDRAVLETRLSAIEAREFDASMFEPPADYSRGTMDGL